MTLLVQGAIFGGILEASGWGMALRLLSLKARCRNVDEQMGEAAYLPERRLAALVCPDRRRRCRGEYPQMDPSVPIRARIFIAVTAACGLAVLGASFLHWHSNDLLKFACYLTIALLASTMKVRLPGMESTMSVHFLFVLLGVLELSLPETLAIGCAAALLQSIWKTKDGADPIKVVFNVLSMTAPAIGLTFSAYHISAGLLHDSMPLLLLVAAFAYFLTNTIPVAVVITLVEGNSLRKVWKQTYFWSLPYYLIGAAVVGLVSYVDQFIGWENALLIVPVMYWIYRSYLLYLGRLEDERKRAEMEACRWRRRSGT